MQRSAVLRALGPRSGQWPPPLHCVRAGRIRTGRPRCFLAWVRGARTARSSVETSLTSAAPRPSPVDTTPFSPAPELDYTSAAGSSAKLCSEDAASHFRRDAAKRPMTKRSRVPAIPEPTSSDPWNLPPAQEDADARRTVCLVRGVLVEPDLLEHFGTCFVSLPPAPHYNNLQFDADRPNGHNRPSLPHRDLYARTGQVDAYAWG